MNHIEEAYRKNDLGLFWKQLNEATQISSPGLPLTGIKEGEDVITDKTHVDKKAKAHFEALMTNQLLVESNKKVLAMCKNPNKITTFTENDIEQALLQCKFNSGMRPDKFSG